jgi:glucose-6-phosphate 1-epimerase
VWNPWIAKSKTLSDFRDNDYLQMICIEPTNAAGFMEGKTIDVEPGATWKASQTISVTAA